MDSPVSPTLLWSNISLKLGSLILEMFYFHSRKKTYLSINQLKLKFQPCFWTEMELLNKHNNCIQFAGTLPKKIMEEQFRLTKSVESLFLFLPSSAILLSLNVTSDVKLIRYHRCWPIDLKCNGYLQNNIIQNITTRMLIALDP